MKKQDKNIKKTFKTKENIMPFIGFIYETNHRTNSSNKVVKHKNRVRPSIWIKQTPSLS
jgi:hypothetical protein